MSIDLQRKQPNVTNQANTTFTQQGQNKAKRAMAHKEIAQWNPLTAF